MPSAAARKYDVQEQTLDVEVVERKDAPGAWTVEAIDNAGDGAIYQAIFVGPEAQARAAEYARFKYGQ